MFTAKTVFTACELAIHSKFNATWFSYFCNINFFIILLNFISSLFIWKLKNKSTFLSKIKWNSLVGFESSSENLEKCLGEQTLFVFNVCIHSRSTKWFQRSTLRGILKQNFYLLVFKTQQPETAWLWISKYNKIVKDGQSFYLKVEPLNSSLWSKNSIQG